MNYQQFTYNLIRAESQPHTNIDPQLDSSSCCCCQTSLHCQCICHSGICCQGNCQITPTTMPTVNIQERFTDEMTNPKTARQIRRDKSSIQLKPNSIETNNRLNIKLKGSQSSNNIFKQNNLSSYNRDTYTTYNRQERQNNIPNTINENDSLRTERLYKATGRRSKSFVNDINTSNSKGNKNIKIETNIHKDKEEKKKFNNKHKNPNEKIKTDLETFNQELLILKQKLANGKKSIPKYPNPLDKSPTTNSNNSLHNDTQIETPPSNLNNLNMYYSKDNTISLPYTHNINEHKDNTRNNNKNIYPKNKIINNTFRGIPNGHNVLSINNSKHKYADNKKQHFSFTIKGESLLESNPNELQHLIEEKDSIIEKLTQKINSLTSQLNSFNHKYNDKITTLQNELNSKHKQLSKYENDFKQLKQKIKTLQYIKHNKDKLIITHNVNSLFIKSSYGLPQSKRTVTTTTTIENTKSKKAKMISSSSTSRLLNKLNINTDLTLSNNSFKSFKQHPPLSDQLIFKNHSTSQSIICFDFISKSFYFFNYADFNNFDASTHICEGSLFLTYNSILYMITGFNYDMLYSYTLKDNSINKLCSLNNNHHYGAFAVINKNELICISGSHNKKVEVYSIHKNEWNELPELNIERSEFAICVLNERYIYVLFGFNAVMKEYLNTIEFYDYGKRKGGYKWKYLKYENEKMISMYMKGHIAGEFEGTIIIMGGVNGNDNVPEENFIVVNVGMEDEKDCGEDGKYEQLKVEKVERKVKDVYKNGVYMFGTSFSEIWDENGRKFMVAFDEGNHVHSIQKGNLGHDVFYAE